MLESLEGKRGQPRVKPPFPAVVGAFGAPTVINNVETLCQRAAHHRRAAPTGSRRSAPTSATPAPSSTPSPATSSARAPTSIRSASPSARCSTACGGMLQGAARSRRSSPAAPRRRSSRRTRSTSRWTSTRVAKAGSMLGSAAVIVMDETTCMVRSVARLAKFFNHESCGQCTPCREGTNWMELLLKRIEHGEGDRARRPSSSCSICNAHRRQLALRPGRRGDRPGAVAGQDASGTRSTSTSASKACPFPHRRYFEN